MGTVKSFPGGHQYDWNGLANVPEVLKNMPTGVAVGQLLQVTGVDGEGKITAVQSVELGPRLAVENGALKVDQFEAAFLQWPDGSNTLRFGYRSEIEAYKKENGLIELV